VTKTRRLFHEELQDLTHDVARLGALVRQAIEAGTAAFLAGDLRDAEAVIVGDRAIDQLAHSVESRVSDLLARQQPMAADLRLLLSALRISYAMERMGDNMVNVVKGTRRLYPYLLEPPIQDVISRMHEQAVAQLDVAITAFVERDVNRATALEDMDDAMDHLQHELFRLLFHTHATDDAAIQTAVQVGLLGRYFERIADLTVTIGERVRYMVTGEFPFEEG